MSQTNYVLADPSSGATHGVLDENIGIATLGWIIEVKYQKPDITIPTAQYDPTHFDNLLADPRRDWWLRKDESDPWVGPMSYTEANSKARRMTMDVDETINELKYAQLGTLLGDREGDPIQLNPHMMVAFIYCNGKQYLGGQLARYNADKVPVE
jgi:hypothetical protein